MRWQLSIFDSVKNPITLDQKHHEKGFSNFQAKLEQQGEETQLVDIQVDAQNLYYFFDTKLVKAGEVKFSAFYEKNLITSSLNTV